MWHAFQFWWRRLLQFLSRRIIFACWRAIFAAWTSCSLNPIIFFSSREWVTEPILSTWSVTSDGLWSDCASIDEPSNVSFLCGTFASRPFNYCMYFQMKIEVRLAIESNETYLFCWKTLRSIPCWKHCGHLTQSSDQYFLCCQNHLVNDWIRPSFRHRLISI